MVTNRFCIITTRWMWSGKKLLCASWNVTLISIWMKHSLQNKLTTEIVSGLMSSGWVKVERFYIIKFAQQFVFWITMSKQLFVIALNSVEKFSNFGHEGIPIRSTLLDACFFFIHIFVFLFSLTLLFPNFVFFPQQKVNFGKIIWFDFRCDGRTTTFYILFVEWNHQQKCKKFLKWALQATTTKKSLHKFLAINQSKRRA